MHIDKDSWLSSVRMVTKRFIENNYSDEASLFDAFWQAFVFKRIRAITADPSCRLSIQFTREVMTEISFIKGYSQDFVSPIVALTVAEVLRELNTKKYSAVELQDIIHSAAARHGAKPSLTACLIRGLPSLCNEIQACRNDTSEALVRESLSSQYRIWVEGKEIILSNLDKYRKNEDKYLFWIDLDADVYVSHKYPNRALDPRAVELLKHLIENIGIRISINHIIRDVYKNVDGLSEDHNKGKIAQHITQLNNFCTDKDKFKLYLFSGWRQNGLGLSNDFKNKYFLFKRTGKGEGPTDQLPNALRS